MNSSELSSLAGVTIRTLRHYHHVGILEEPPRGANRYRQYGVHDLIRVLRIRRLAGLGIPLDQMPTLLDGEDHGADAVLGRLDDEIAAQIERLTAQRELIAQLRALSATPDVPPSSHGSSATSPHRRHRMPPASIVIKRFFSHTWSGPPGCHTSSVSTSA